VRYLIVLEKGPTSYGAFAPDLPGCVAVGETPEETLALMRQAIAMHLRGMREDGHAIPPPTATADNVDAS
jgi:predicted RNase H-like HicB family nuclease